MHRVGVATEVYNQIVNSLYTDCRSMGGKFTQKRFLNTIMYGGGTNKGRCEADFEKVADVKGLINIYQIGKSDTKGNWLGKENMCPYNYWFAVDTESWGVCSCWDNGGRRSDNGTMAKCGPGMYDMSYGLAGNDNCTDNMCERSVLDSGDDAGKVCPGGADGGECSSIANTAAGSCCALSQPSLDASSIEGSTTIFARIDSGTTFTSSDASLVVNGQSPGAIIMLNSSAVKSGNELKQSTVYKFTYKTGSPDTWQAEEMTIDVDDYNLSDVPSVL